MTPQKALDRAFEIMGGKRAMAAALKAAGYHKITSQAVGAWRQRLPRKWVLQVEAIVAAKSAEPVPNRRDFRPDIYGADDCVPSKMPEAILKPAPPLAAKLGNIIRRTEGFYDAGGSPGELAAIRQLIADPEVQEWLKAMAALGLFPVKHSNS